MATNKCGQIFFIHKINFGNLFELVCVQILELGNKTQNKKGRPVGMNIGIELFDAEKYGMSGWLWTVGGGAIDRFFCYQCLLEYMKGVFGLQDCIRD